MWRAGAQMSREPPPPLPGGYVVNDKVYYTGTGGIFKDGDRLEHGKQGEVVRPATGQRHRGKGVAVLFPGNKGTINCNLTKARRQCSPARPPPPTPARCPDSCAPTDLSMSINSNVSFRFVLLFQSFSIVFV